jgi:hypothetical protein
MKLKHLLAPILSAGFAVSACAGTADTKGAPPVVQPPADTSLGATLTVGYDSDYVFRGVEFAKNLVSGDLDWVVPFNKVLSLDLNAWYGASANSEAAPFAGGHSYGELDLSPTLNAKIDLGNESSLTFGLKYTWYHYMMNAHNFIDDVNEVGGNVKYTSPTIGLGTFDIWAGAYRDFTAKGWYFEYAVDYKPGVLLSNASHYYGVDGGNNFKPWLAMPINLTKTATLTPYIAGNIPYGSLRDNGEERRVYGGVALSVTF